MQSTPTDKKNIAYATASDVELLQHIKEGDKWAFVEIVSRYQATVSGVALAILRDFAASEDVAQETFLSAWQKIDQVKQGDKLRAWLCSIARTTALMHLRKRKKEVPLDSSSAGLVDFSNQPDESLANDEDTALVLSALDKLPQNYRLPLILFYRQGKSVRAVAEALDITEATAKKRLSRGREMLREGISGLVESVLSRRLPTATFTMAVAASIGALSPPSAVAGAVFVTTKSSSTTAGVAGAKTATPLTTLNGGGSFTTSFIGKFTGITTMTKLTLTTAAAIVMCLTAGYYTAAMTNPQKVVALNTSDDISSVKSDQKKGESLSESEIEIEWKRLQKQFGAEEHSWSLIHAEITKNPSAFQKRALFSVLASEWAKNSPESGLVFYAKNSDWRSHWQSKLFANELVTTDGWEALDMIVEKAPSLKWGNDFREWVPDMMEALLPKLQERGPEDLAEMINQVNVMRAYRRGYQPRKPIGDAFAKLAEYDLKYALSTSRLVSSGHKKEVLSGVAKAWAEMDGLPAVEWAQKQLDGVERDSVVRYALQGLAKVDPIAAMERVGMAPPGNGFYTTEKMVLQAAGEKDLGATLEWMRDNPKAFGKSSMSGLSDTLTSALLKDSEGFLSEAKDKGTLGIVTEGIRSALINQGAVAGQDIWKWLSVQENTDEIMHLRRETLGAVMRGDPESSIHILSQMSGDEMDSLTKYNGINRPNILGRLLGQGGVDKLDYYLSLASPDLQTRLVETGFRALREKDLHDPEVWIDRFSRVPEEGKIGALKSLSRAWAQRDPMGSLAWVDNLTDSKQQEAGFSSSISGWIKKNLYEVAEWAEQLPQGDRRDISFASLAKASESREDASRWIESIVSSSRKVDAIEQMSIAPLRHLPQGGRQEAALRVTEFIDPVGKPPALPA